MPNSPVQHVIQVPFDESDGEGIVFFGNYFRLAHRALENMLPTIGISWTTWFANKDWGVPLRHVEADYQKPIRPGDKVTISMHLENLGQSSVTFQFLFTAENRAELAQVKTTHVFTDRSTFKKIEIPAVIRTALLTLPK